MGKLMRFLGRCRKKPITKDPPGYSTYSTYSTPSTTPSTTPPPTTPPFLSLPNELLLIVADHLDEPHDLSALTRSSRRLALLLAPLLLKLALSDKHGVAAIHWAARRGHSSLVTLALQHGVPVDSADWTRRTPLHRAMDTCHEQTIALLLSHGASVSVRDMVGYTPLHLALRNLNTPVRAPARQLATTRMLLAHGADPNAVTDDGDTPLHCAAHFGARTAVIRVLLQHGADPLQRNQRRRRPADDEQLRRRQSSYRLVKRSEWVAEKGWVYALLCAGTGYPAEERRYRVVRMLYGRDCQP